MDVDTGLATLSDQLILGTVLLYLAAMIGFALDLAFGRARTRGARAAAEPVAAAVGAAQAQGAPGGAAAGPETPEAPGGAPAAEDAAPAAWAVRAGSVAVLLAWAGWAANAAGLVTRGLAVGRWPWGNMYEFVVAVCLATMTAFLVLLLRRPIRFLGAFVTLAAALGLGFAVLYLHVQAGPVVPALNSYWIAIHVSAAVIASGLFLVAGVAGVLYLVRGDGPSRLPDRADLERLAYRVIVIAFPIWTFAVIAGALWADRAWGRYWGWDPKEVWSFITWIAYAAYLHAWATAGWRGRKATVLQLIALACLLFNLVGVNLLFEGLHSYADVR